ncbi:MAG: ketoacyl-ACP synthase III [Saprospiraceae bacterium]|nr:ketoacyl-ACP synthase III [Saprospiraceae bacterium]MBK8633945.1 ketoacyl-ACP synthase III [Saprospiraceae bacterium]
MTKFTAAITSVGGYVPKDILTNEDLAKMVDTSDEWITSRTGIKERHIIKEKGIAASDLGVEAVKIALEKRNMDPSEIDLLICATISPDMRVPDTANTILDKIGAKNAWGFDINAACSGFLFALTTGAQFIESGMHKKVVVVGSDVMSTVVDYTDRTTCILFGDGAGAVILEASEEGFGLQDSVLRGDGSGRNMLNIKAGGSLMPITNEILEGKDMYIYQDGKSVFKAAVNGMSGAINQLMARNDLAKEDISWIVPHQANKRIINSIGEYLDFPMEKVMTNIAKYGNTTAATLPLCLFDYESQLKKGDKLVFTAFGGGFTWGASYLIWAYDGQ